MERCFSDFLNFPSHFLTVTIGLGRGFGFKRQVSAGPVGMPLFTTTEGLKYADAGAVRPLPPNTRLSYRQVACGVDDAGVVACFNSRDQVGFVVGPTASFAASNLPPVPPPPPPSP